MNTEIKSRTARITRYIRNKLFILLIIFYILFEEFIWKNAVDPIIRTIAAYHFYQRFLDYVRFRAGRLSVLVLFMIPFAVGEGVGTLSALMASQLHLISAAILYGLKIPLIVISLGILQNGKEKLLSYPWFALCYNWVMLQIEKLHNSYLYRQVHINLFRIRRRLRNRSSRFNRWMYHIRNAVRKKKV